MDEQLKKRLNDLKKNIDLEYELLYVTEKSLLLEDHPRRRVGYQNDIKEFRDAIDSHKAEYSRLVSELGNAQQDGDKALPRLEQKIDDVLSALQDFQNRQGQHHQILLNRIDSQEDALIQALTLGLNAVQSQTAQIVIKEITERLNETQLETLKLISHEVESNRLSKMEMSELLGNMRKTYDTSPITNISDAQKGQLEKILDDTSLEVKHRLKLVLSLFFIKYEAEIALTGSDKLGEIYRAFKKKIWVRD